LFSDRRAESDDELPDPKSTDRRGWWGDNLSELDGDQIGSRLWLLERSKTTPDIPRLAEQYASEALQWLIDEGIAIKIDVAAARGGIVGNDRLELKVEIYKKDGNKEVFEFENLWDGQFD
jgi:phage gp46-like protein